MTPLLKPGNGRRELDLAGLENILPNADFAIEGYIDPREPLRDHQYRTSIGVGYQFALPWGEEKPTADRITVLARYRSPDGQVITSLPSAIVTSIQ